MKLPLEGLKVLDLSHALAGPYCSTMLADYGADVIKIEPPGKGDIARAWGTQLPGGETDYFIGLHRNKKGIVLDLKNPQGKETVKPSASKGALIFVWIRSLNQRSVTNLQVKLRMSSSN